MDLKISICSILKSVSEETVHNIIAAVKDAGFESLLDLQFVEEEDLVLVLKPIHRRKLVKVWSEQTLPNSDSNCLQQHKFRWRKGRGLKLLDVYTKYKLGFSHPGVEEQRVWRKIADELREKYSLKCDEFHCCSKIKALKSSYEKLKNKMIATRDIADFLEKARRAFEIPVQQVKDLDEQLKSNIHSILNSVSEETVCSIINALRRAGLQSLSDLQLVKEKDLLIVTKPIQRRKLLKAWREPVIPIAEVPNSETKPKCKWLFKRRLALLRLYTMHKAEFSSPDDLSVWEKIANKLKTFSSGFNNCDASQCKNQIHFMKYAYENEKKLSNTAGQEMVIFLDEAKRAFDTLENPVSFSEQTRHKNGDKQTIANLQKWTCGGKDRRKLLQVYAKYKTELVTPYGHENQKVWEKIAKETSEKCSQYYGVLRCQYVINSLRKKYECFKNKDPRIFKKIRHIFKEMQEAFETTECPEAEAGVKIKEEINPIKEERMEEESAEKCAETGMKRKNEESKNSDVAEVIAKKVKVEKETETVKDIVIKQEIEEA